MIGGMVAHDLWRRGQSMNAEAAAAADG